MTSNVGLKENLRYKLKETNPTDISYILKHK